MNSLLRLIGRRLVAPSIMVAGVSFLIFFIMSLSPIDPAHSALGETATLEVPEEYRVQHGLSDPFSAQYDHYLWNMLHSDLGTYGVGTSNRATDLAVQALLTILQSAFLGLFFAVIIAFPLGVLVTLYRDRWPDQVIRVFSVIGIGTPSFWLAALSVPGFVQKLPVSDPLPALSEDPSGWLPRMLLPAIALAAPVTGQITRVVCTSTVEEPDRDYVRTVVGAGILKRIVVARNVLRNALITPVTVLDLRIGYPMGGAVVVETISSIDGMGKVVLLEGIQGNWVTLVQGGVLVVATTFIVANIIVNMLYLLIDSYIRSVRGVNQKEKLGKVTAKGARFSRISVMLTGLKIAVGLLVLIVLVSVLVSQVSPYGPDDIFDRWSAPFGEHLFGTDHVGRDVLVCVLLGRRYSLMVGLCSTLIAFFFGVIIGLIAAVVRKSSSGAIMRVMDITMAMPGIAMATVSILIFGRTLSKSGDISGLVIVTICSIAFVYIPQLSHIVHANATAAYGEDYVRAVVVSGARAPWTLTKHVMRNTAALVFVFATALAADTIILETSLIFIGSGLQVTTVATWGNALSEASSNLLVLLGKWWTTLFPGLFIMITVLYLNILSEGITDVMVAAPASVAVAQADKDTDRETDKLLLDLCRAYAERAESLQTRPDDLESVEGKRTDRFGVYLEKTPLFEVNDLCTKSERHGNVSVIDHVSFKTRPGETVDLVGEPGCGKSITALAIIGLIDLKAQIMSEILYQGENLLKKSVEERRVLLGHEMAMIHQDAPSSLNLAMLIKAQMKQLTSCGGTRSAEELLELAGPDPKCTLESYPHELSGGQRQRVLIAVALTRGPELIIADESTTTLDVTVQKRVIVLLSELHGKLGFVMIFVSHDLAFVAEMVYHITVMYAGQVIEQAPTKEPLTYLTYEYTRGLLGAVLSIESDSGQLHQVSGTVPSPRDFPAGDRLAPRSSHPDYGLDVRPVLIEVDSEHVYATLLPRDEADGFAQEMNGQEET